MSRDPGRGCGRPNGGSIRLAPQVGRARRGRSAGLDFEDAIARSVLLDLAAPGAGLVAARLDEALEALQVSLDARRHDADHVADVLDQALGLVLELKHDARLRGREAVEGHDARIRRSVDVAPGDALVGDLLGDASVPLLLLAADVRLPVEA